MRILGGAHNCRIPSSKEILPTPLRRQSSNDRNKNSNDTNTDICRSCFDTWRIRNADEDDERVAIGKYNTKTIERSRSEKSTEPWLSAIVIVSFDHDKGPIFERIEPLSNNLTKAELETVLYHAMPDSASMNSDNEQVYYTFRIPRRVHDNEHSNVSVISTRLLLAHVLFKQFPDSSTPRGFFQKSLVLITSTPYIGLPYLILSLLSVKIFNRHVSSHYQHSLKNIITNISDWPDPRQSANHNNANSDSQTNLLLPFGEELLSIQWTNAFLTSFACPKVCLYKNHDGHIDSFSSLSLPNMKSLSSNHSPPRSLKSSIYLNYNIAQHTNGKIQHHNNDGPDTERTTYDDGLTCRSNDNNSKSKPMLTNIWPLMKPMSYSSAPLFHEINPVISLASVIDLIPAIWEIIMIGEPLLVVGSTPTECSSAVMSIMSLLHPLSVIGDWRPYLCIQDNEYFKIVNCNDIYDLFPDGAIYGVSSKHMVETMNFPHVLFVSKNKTCDNNINNIVNYGRLTSKWKSHFTKSKTLKQIAMKIIYHHSNLNTNNTSTDSNNNNKDNNNYNSNYNGNNKTENDYYDDYMFDLVNKFRLFLHDKYTSPFLRVFDRYLVPICKPSIASASKLASKLLASQSSSSLSTSTLTSTSTLSSSSSSPSSAPFNNNEVYHSFYSPRKLNGYLGISEDDMERYKYEMDPFDKKLQLLKFQSSKFPTNEDMQLVPQGLFRRGRHWKRRVRATYQRFVQGAVFREWFHERLLQGNEKCQSLHLKYVSNACKRGCSIILHDIRNRKSLNNNQGMVTDEISELATRIWRELKRAKQNDHLKLKSDLELELDYLMNELPGHKQQLFEEISQDHSK